MTRMQPFHTFINICTTKNVQNIINLHYSTVHVVYSYYSQLKRLPMHTLPFPLYPFKHAHEKLPNVLVQLALT